MPETIVLYTAKICPYAQRAELALEEAKADYTPYQIDLQNKPEWYAPKVNPASKVPAIAYGGPPVPPDQPSPESTKLAESLILVEFVADLFPDAHLLPADPVARARARFFVDVVSTKLNPAWNTFFRNPISGSDDAFLAAVTALQALLPAQGFAVGAYSIADIAVAPFLARAYLALRNDIGAFEPAQGRAVLVALEQQARFARFRKYWEELQARPNFKATFDEAYIIEAYKRRLGGLRKQ